MCFRFYSRRCHVKQVFLARQRNVSSLSAAIRLHERVPPCSLNLALISFHCCTPPKIRLAGRSRICCSGDILSAPPKQLNVVFGSCSAEPWISIVTQRGTSSSNKCVLQRKQDLGHVFSADGSGNICCQHVT